MLALKLVGNACCLNSGGIEYRSQRGIRKVPKRTKKGVFVPGPHKKCTPYFVLQLGAGYLEDEPKNHVSKTEARTE